MMQQTQGVQIKGRTADDFATLTADGAKQRLDASTVISGTDGSVVTVTGGKLDVNSVAPVGGATSDLQATLNELVARLDALAACKHHLTEAMRVQVVGNVSQAVTGSVTVSGTANVTDVTVAAANIAPGRSLYNKQVSLGNNLAIVSNIQNVVV